MHRDRIMKTRHILLSLTALPAFAFGLNLHGASTLKFEYSQYSATEDTPSVLVAVVRAGDLTGPASVEVVSSDVSATAGEDYEAISLTVEFAEGEEVQTFRVPLLNDGIKEAAESFRVRLNNPSEGATLGRPGAAIILEDNDPGVQFPWKHFWGYERDGRITVTVERGNDGDLSALTVNYATSDLTALAGLDYTAASGILEFAEGEMTKTIIIPVADDAEIEPREEFQITLSDPTGPGGLGPNSAAEIWLHDTTGHEPRRLGMPQLIDPGNGQARLEAPISGRSGGENSLWFEIFGVESSGDLRTWDPESWLGIASPELPGTFQHEVGATDLRFFKPNTAALLAGWPPPESSGGVFATREAAVGYTERWVTDPTRRNRYGISDNSSFHVAIWYPATPRTGVMPKQPLSNQAMHFFIDSWDYPATNPDPNTRTYSFQNIPFRTPGTEPPSQHPIILYSHAGEPWGSGSEDPWSYAEYLASQGYIVMAPDHYDCWATSFPDGTAYEAPTIPARNAAGFQDRVRDFEVLLEVLPEWQESDPILSGRLDLTHLGVMGHQWGAGVAGELCRTVEACRAGVLLSGGSLARSWTGADTLMEEGPKKPVMFIQWEGESAKDLYTQIEQEAVWFQVADSTWNSLHTWYSWNNPVFDRPIEQTIIDHEIAHTLNAYVGSFFSAKVLGQTDEVLWKGPSEEHPRVINYQSK